MSSDATEVISGFMTEAISGFMTEALVGESSSNPGCCEVVGVADCELLVLKSKLN